MIIAVSGTPGTGKTAIAGKLAERLGYAFMELNMLAEEKGLYEGYDRKRKCKIVDLEALKEEVEKLEGDFVLESHYAHEMPCDVVVILHTSPGELRKRLEKRGWATDKIEENVEAEIMEICKTEALGQGKKVVEVDTTGKDTEKVVDEIIKALNKNPNPGGKS